MGLDEEEYCQWSSSVSQYGSVYAWHLSIAWSSPILPKGIFTSKAHYWPIRFAFNQNQSDDKSQSMIHSAQGSKNWCCVIKKYT